MKYSDMVKANEEAAFQDTSAKPKLEFVCTCGATRFTWKTTNGRITVGGFQPEDYTYQCIGCGKEWTDLQVKEFFAK